MNSFEIERLIDIISDDEIEIDEFELNSQPIQLILKNPTPKTKAKSSRIYQRELKKALILGLMSEDEAIEDFIKLGRWSSEYETQIDGLKSDIHKIKRGLIDLIFKRDILEKSRTLLRRAELKLMELLLKRHKLLEPAAEGQALLSQQRYMISQVTFLENGDKFWSNDQIFNTSSEFKLIDKLCNIFFKTSRVNIITIREMARSNIWRSIWSSCKTGNPFGKPILELSYNQQSLVHWSCVYDGVYEAYERPTKDIIEDDDILDSWFIKQGEKIESKSKKQFGDDVTSKSKRKGGRNEQFIMADREGAKGVYGMNDPNTRNLIKQKQNIINTQKIVKEQHMPDSQNEMRKIAVDQLKRHVLKKR